MLTLTGALLGGVACDNDDPTAPTVGGVAGSYRATAFTVTYHFPVTSPPVTTDVLSTGGSFTFSLAADGAVTGSVEIPTEGLDFTFAGGTWRLEGDRVEFQDIPGTVTFVEDLEFDVSGSKLTADQLIDSVWRIHLVMTKQ
jgi:hypothetical protein